MKLFIFWLLVSNLKCNFLFFEFNLVTRSVTFYFSKLRVSNSKVKKWKFNPRVSNSKFNLIFYKLESVTWKKISINILELVTQIVTSFCVTQFHNSRIPDLLKNEIFFLQIKKFISYTLKAPLLQKIVL